MSGGEHQAASGGSTMTDNSSGRSEPSGQFSENHRIASLYLRSVMSDPERRSVNFLLSLKTR